MECLYSYFTHAGTVKETNQDSLLIKKGQIGEDIFYLFLVCDGMGGLEKGEVASAQLVHEFSEWFEDELPDLWEEKDPEFVTTAIEVSFRRLLDRINRKIAGYGKSLGIQLGSTASAMLIANDSYYVIHIGDTRIYEVTDCVRRLTEDHTLVAKEIAMGNLREEDAEADSRRNVLLQCIGASEYIEPQFLTGKVLKNAVYLLCSDGFRHEITEHELLSEFAVLSLSDSAQIHEKCKRCVQMVMDRGEQDNITVVTARTL